jgi:hypothetical protein
MLHVNAFVKDLAEADSDRFENAKQAVKQWRPKVRIVNEVVRDAIDIPRDAHRVNEAKNEHDPERGSRKEMEHSEEIDAVENRSEHGQRVPAGVRKNL